MRELEHGGAAPDVTRLSDEEETRLSLTLASGSLGTRVMRTYLAARGRSNACLAIVGWEDSEPRIGRRRAAARAILRRHEGLDLGSAPGAAWLKGRYHGPYVRDELLRHGVLVETLETATTWSGCATRIAR